MATAKSIDRVTNVKVRRRAVPYGWMKLQERPTVQSHWWLVDFKRMGSPRCCVYIIAPDNKWPCKIGIATAPARRLADLQVAHWREIEIQCVFWVESTRAAMIVEAAAHRRAEESGKRLMGEWVDARPDEAREMVEWASLETGIAVNSEPPSDARDQIQAEIDRMWDYPTFFKAEAARHEVTGW